MKNSKKKKGFTLVEVLVVVLIVGILAAIAIPSYHFTIERSRATQGITSLTQIAKAQKTYSAKRGKYAESMIGLPLDMKDSDGSEATGAEFADQYFDYKIFGDEFERARATRNTGEYELSVDYGTGQIFCRPIEHKICQDLNLAEGEELITWPQKKECSPSDYQYSDKIYNCTLYLFKDGTKRAALCNIDTSLQNSTCHMFNNEDKRYLILWLGIHQVMYMDPETGKKTKIYQYNTDGTLKWYERQENGIRRESIQFSDSDTRIMIYDEGTEKNYYTTYFPNNGNAYVKRYVNNFPKYTQYYDAEGRVSHIIYNSSELNARVYYNPDGSIKSSSCSSGCDGWEPPEISSLYVAPEKPVVDYDCLKENSDYPAACGTF